MGSRKGLNFQKPKCYRNHGHIVLYDIEVTASLLNNDSLLSIGYLYQE